MYMQCWSGLFVGMGGPSLCWPGSYISLICGLIGCARGFLCHPRKLLDVFDALRIVFISGWGSVTRSVMLGPGLAHLFSYFH